MDARFHALLVLHHVHLYGLLDDLPEGPDPAGHRRDLRPVPLADRRDFAGQARLALRARPADGASGPGQSVRELTGRGSRGVDDRCPFAPIAQTGSHIAAACVEWRRAAAAVAAGEPAP